ncbi:MAG: hypothetical protein AAGA67_01195 [Cyanobacteria bacterium P01_F01_bin.153]
MVAQRQSSPSGNHWAIAIGITNYPFLPAVRQGEADAMALHHLWKEKPELGEERCLQLSDHSRPCQGRPTYPNRENIEFWLNRVCQNLVQTGDYLWCLLSGYSVCHNGQDYFMAIEGSPDRVPSGCIAMRDIYTQLAAACDRAGRGNVLLLLDIHHAWEGYSGAEVGNDIRDLAREYDIPTINANQQGQQSQYSPSTHTGVFMAGLMAAMSDPMGTNLFSLERGLADRMAQQCKEDRLGLQQPKVIVKEHNALYHDVMQSPAGGEDDSTAPYILFPPQDAAGVAEASADIPIATTAPIATVIAPPPPVIPPPPAAAPVTAASEPESDSPGLLKWLPLAIGALILLLLLGVLWRNWGALVGQFQGLSLPGTESTEDGGPPPASEAGAPAPAAAEAAALQQAQQAIQQGNYRQAVDTIDQVPGEKSEAAQQVRSQALTAINQDTLGRARMPLQLSQASEFSKAIAEARKVRKGDPLYAQAQQDIKRWARVMLDLAKGRARQGNFAGAIGALNLVPTDVEELQEERSRLLQQWPEQQQQQQSNRLLLQQAFRLLRPGQASSYNQAIGVARRIRPGQPEYYRAQASIDQWSRNILSIAESRASSGQLGQALQTAALIPEGTAASSAAKQAIIIWRRRLGG